MTKTKAANKRKTRRARARAPEDDSHTTELMTGLAVVGGVGLAATAAVIASPVGAPLVAAGTALAAQHPLVARVGREVFERSVEKISAGIGKAIFDRFR